MDALGKQMEQFLGFTRLLIDQAHDLSFTEVVVGGMGDLRHLLVNQSSHITLCTHPRDVLDSVFVRIAESFEQ